MALEKAEAYLEQAGFADRIFHIIDGKIVKIENGEEYREEMKHERV